MHATRSRLRRSFMASPMLLAVAMAAGLSVAATPAAAKESAQIVHPAYQGPKKTIAVSKFDASGAFVGRYGGWDIGGGLAAMLAAELSRTNRFIVVERADIDTLLREKQMALSDVTAGGSGGPLLGVQTFIRGSVTEFDEQEKGGGLNFGFNSGGVIGGLGGRKSSGHVTIDLRLIDAASGAVVGTYKVDKKLSNSALALQAQTGGFAFGGDQFAQSSLGRAVREAIAEATLSIVGGMDRVPWQALVANVEGDRVYINAGRNANLTPGARMRAVRRERVITDPATGEVLGGEQRTIGDLVIDTVDHRFAVGRWISAEAPRRGDTVQLIAG